ncbi:MarR family transcriptional regulator [Actinoallomurus sp. NBC_01490]|uniref:MarR family transcriptional regulator n=1 Tax=Actinoallomurus sp. NBC_01490 TaxID=2903557 RepID=UPI003FA4A83E
MTATQVVALRELSDPITAREPATRMVCEPSNVTYVLDRLEGQGMIERRPHPTDRRAKQLVLTPVGRRYRADVLARLKRPLPARPAQPRPAGVPARAAPGAHRVTRREPARAPLSPENGARAESGGLSRRVRVRRPPRRGAVRR